MSKFVLASAFGFEQLLSQLIRLQRNVFIASGLRECNTACNLKHFGTHICTAEQRHVRPPSVPPRNPTPLVSRGVLPWLATDRFG